ncbi:MAG: hypothetical protein ACK4N5_14830, partial [Myxococcales bacterium]
MMAGKRQQEGNSDGAAVSGGLRMPVDEFLATADLSDAAVALLETLAHERKLRTLGDLVDFAQLHEGAALQRRAGAALAREILRGLGSLLREKAPATIG